MFSHILASALLAFSLLPQTVQPEPSADAEPVTRAEAATALLLARNPNVAVIKNVGQFPDVLKDDWFSPYMLAAEKVKIINADPVSHHLRPMDPITRVEFLKMLSLTFAIPTGYKQSYTDVPRNLWYSEYAGIVPKFQLPLQDDTYHLNPSQTVTNKQALGIIQKFLQLYHESSDSIFAEQQLAINESTNQLKLYTTISTRHTTAVFSINQEKKVTTPPPVASSPTLPQLRTQILSMVNTERLKEGLKPLVYNQQLEESAERYAEKMATEGFFGHVSPQGEVLKDRIGATGYYSLAFSPDCGCVKGFTLGENLGRGQTTAKEVVDAWMASKEHRAAILNPDYSDTGIGVASGIWVQHFGGVLLPGKKVGAK